MVKTVLVTGATGFAGSHIMEALQGRERVQVIAARRDGRKLLPSFGGEVREGNTSDPGYRKAVVEGVNVNLQCAYLEFAMEQCRKLPVLFLEPNLALIEAARAAGVRRFVNTSTTSAAGATDSLEPSCPGGSIQSAASTTYDRSPS